REYERPAAPAPAAVPAPVAAQPAPAPRVAEPAKPAPAAPERPNSGLERARELREPHEQRQELRAPVAAPRVETPRPAEQHQAEQRPAHHEEASEGAKANKPHPEDKDKK